MRHAADEIVATFEDGHEERTIVRRASSRRTIRTFQKRFGFKSVDVVRWLTIDEWRAYCAGTPGVRTLRPPAATAPPPAGGDPAPSGVYAWEVLTLEHGNTRMMRVAGPSEDVAIGLVMRLDGVSAAVAIRPLSLEQYREAARPAE